MEWDKVQHSSDCATNNAPAYPPGACDCIVKTLRDEARAIDLSVLEDEDCLIIYPVGNPKEQDLWWFGRDATDIHDAREKALAQVRRLAS